MILRVKSPKNNFEDKPTPRSNDLNDKYRKSLKESLISQSTKKRRIKIEKSKQCMKWIIF